MDLHDAALVIAGIVGSTTAIVHGAVTQRQMVRPVHELTAGKLPGEIRGTLHMASHTFALGVTTTSSVNSCIFIEQIEREGLLNNALQTIPSSLARWPAFRPSRRRRRAQVLLRAHVPCGCRGGRAAQPACLWPGHA